MINKNSKELISTESLSNSLDSLKRNSNNKFAPCRAKDLIVQSEKGSDDLYKILRIFCKSYSCPYCGPKKAILMRSLISKAIEKYKLITFATLTLDQTKCFKEDSARHIKKCWNKFRILQKRNFKRSIKYISVLEFQKNGYAHLHILFDSYINHSWLKQTWSSVAGGSIVDIKKINGGLEKYLCKYLVKTFNENAGRGTRLIATSQEIKLKSLIPKSDLKYRFINTDQKEARGILKKYIQSDIADKKGYIQGFTSSKALNIT